MYCSFSIKFDTLNCRTKSDNCFAESRSSLILPIVLPVVLVMFLAIIIILIGKDIFLVTNTNVRRIWIDLGL